MPGPRALGRWKDHLARSLEKLKMSNGPISGCGCCHMNRRKFLAGCATCAAGALGLNALGTRRIVAAESAVRPRVRLVFTHIPSTGPIWPNIGYDFEKRKAELTKKLVRKCSNIDFLPVTAQNAGEANKILENDKEVDGYLVYMVGIWTGAAQAIAAAKRPTIFADDLYGGSGEFLIANAAARRAGLPVVGVSSHDVDDVVHAARCFEELKKPNGSVADFLAACDKTRRKDFGKPGSMKCKEDSFKTNNPAEVVKSLRESTLLIVGNRHDQLIKTIGETFGTRVLPIEFKELDDLYLQANQDEAAEWADRWMKAAKKIVEPTREEIVKCGAMYLAMQTLLKNHNAQGISINCLGGFYGGHIKAYPCLGFAQLNDDGLVGACESDYVSTISMLTMNYLTGRPGYISDPVIDTAKNQIIYAHCVAPTKVFGPQGLSNPYHIRSHSEDRKGAVVRSLMPLGYMTTTVEFHPIRKEVIFHQAKAVDNIDEDKACRTKLAAEPKGDIDKLMTEWDQWGWHRVTVYGDAKGPVEELAKVLNMKMVYEA